MKAIPPKRNAVHTAKITNEMLIRANRIPIGATIRYKVYSANRKNFSLDTAIWLGRKYVISFELTGKDSNPNGTSTTTGKYAWSKSKYSFIKDDDGSINFKRTIHVTEILSEGDPQYDNSYINSYLTRIESFPFKALHGPKYNACYVSNKQHNFTVDLHEIPLDKFCGSWLKFHSKRIPPGTNKLNSTFNPVYIKRSSEDTKLFYTRSLEEISVNSSLPPLKELTISADTLTVSRFSKYTNWWEGTNISKPREIKILCNIRIFVPRINGVYAPTFF
jgi:hypothetical protein